MRRSILSLAVACLLATSMRGLQAQSIWLEPHGGRSIQVEILRPSFDSDEFTFWSFAAFLSGRYAVNDGLVLVGEIPFARIGVDFGGFFGSLSGSESAIGNPYLGVEVGPREQPLLGEFGVRIPVANPGSDLVDGDLFSLLDVVDRWEAFLEDIFSVHAGLNYRSVSSSGIGFRGRLAPTLWFDTGDVLRDDTELFLNYSAQMWYRADRISIGGGLGGRAIITEDEGDLGERTLHQMVLGTTLTAGNFRPGLHLKVPLDKDLTQVYNLSVGLSLGVLLP